MTAIIDAIDSRTLEWIENFASENCHKAKISPKSIREAAQQYFPNVKIPKDATSEQILNTLGIVRAVALGDETIVWSVSTNRSQAEENRQQYSTPAYKNFRKAIGVDWHWILLFDPEILFTLGDLYEAHMNWLDSEERPDCPILTL